VVAIRIRDLTPVDHDWAAELIASESGGTRMIARLGEVIDPLTLDGLVAEVDGQPVGLATLRPSPDAGLEVLTLHAALRGHGVGSALLTAAREVAARGGWPRLWLLTTNDNLGAIRFYLRWGMHVERVHEGAVDRDRRLKPSISVVNRDNGIPITDLVEFAVDPQSPPKPAAFPSVSDLEKLPADACAAALGPLFEGAPGFVVRLVASRPWANDEGLIAAAYQTARELSDDEAVELVNAHPRIGSDPTGMSRMSKNEQGFDADPDEPSWVDEELAGMNEVYEDRFGFRYVTFVAGRPREQVIPLIEASLRNDREAELRRAVADCVAIAEDRLRRLRAEAGAAAPEEDG
jgi:2-oxo-4-hydroxy-4-carboxy--5-ureidoimidazoline (OHCU) decarboxylase/GNAT superfamily N-acetyltransferase